MRRYDSIVVGSGVSGLTLALLLAVNGHSVLLLEKGPRIGGSLARFYRKGVPFDTGFHFTGGFSKNGILNDMLLVLGLRDYTQPIYLSHEKSNRFVFEAEQVEYLLPAGYAETVSRIKEYFPSEARSVERYFEMVASVCSRTDAMGLRRISLYPNVLDEDYVSLDEVLNGLIENHLLRGLLSVYSMCYGVKPSEISFANHSRVCFSLYESVARVKDGGDAFVKGFRECLSKCDVDIRCDTTIVECTAVKNKQVGGFVLNSGEEVSCGQCIFSVHPYEVLKMLPREYLNKAFINRINDFESSAGFFSVFGVVDAESETEDFYPSIFSLFPTADVNRLFDPEYLDVLPLVIMRSIEEERGASHRVLCALELSFLEHVGRWADSKQGRRPPEYQKYKQQRTDLIKARVAEAYPEYKGKFQILDAATMLTFRDYLHSPDGSAYGIKQRIGQFNLFGKLPLRNLYAVGQSSMLPGIVGAMTSSFIVGRSILGKEAYGRFIEERLGHS